MLECRDERQLHALALFIARFGSSVAIFEAERLVGVGLEPHRLNDRFAWGDVGICRRPVVDREHALGPPLDRAQACVGCDRVQPRAQRAAALEPR